MEIGINMIVSGLVQGVGFRYFVLNRANQVGLKGYVKNLYNGDVEIETVGHRSLIENFIKEIKVGPREAHVDDIKITWKKPEQQYKHFEIR